MNEWIHNEGKWYILHHETAVEWFILICILNDVVLKELDSAAAAGESPGTSSRGQPSTRRTPDPGWKYMLRFY